MPVRGAHSSLQACLTKDACRGLGVQVVGPLTGDSDATGLGRVLELPVTAACGHDPPAVLLEQPEDLVNLHAAPIARVSVSVALTRRSSASPTRSARRTAGRKTTEGGRLWRCRCRAVPAKQEARPRRSRARVAEESSIAGRALVSCAIGQQELQPRCNPAAHGNRRGRGVRRAEVEANSPLQRRQIRGDYGPAWSPRILDRTQMSSASRSPWAHRRESTCEPSAERRALDSCGRFVP